MPDKVKLGIVFKQVQCRYSVVALHQVHMTLKTSDGEIEPQTSPQARPELLRGATTIQDNRSFS
jgi:hypothetical protein